MTRHHGVPGFVAPNIIKFKIGPYPAYLASWGDTTCVPGPNLHALPQHCLGWSSPPPVGY